MPADDALGAEHETSDLAAITVNVGPRLIDSVHGSAAIDRANWASAVLAGFFATGVAIGLWGDLPGVVAVFLVLAALALVSGYYTAPLVWLRAFQSGDAIPHQESFTFDAYGVRYRAPNVESVRAWSFYRGARAVGSVVLLDGRLGGGSIVVTRRLSREVKAQLHEVLVRQGLVNPALGTSVFRRVIGLLVGAGLAFIELSVTTVSATPN